MCYLSWAGEYMQNAENSVGINGLFANKLGFQHNEEVAIKKVENVGNCTRAFVEPLSVDDWEILEMHAEEVERSLLNQVRVISTGLVFPIWINKSICIFAKIGDLEPSAVCCRLVERTEVHILPKDRKSVNEVPTSKDKNNDLSNLIKEKNIKEVKGKNASSVRRHKSVCFVQDESADVDPQSDNEKIDIASSEVENRHNGMLNTIFNSVKSWWTGNSVDAESQQKTIVTEKDEYLNGEYFSSLRIQPIGQFRQACDTTERVAVQLSAQPCNVYINHETFQKSFKTSIDDQILHPDTLKVMSSDTNMAFLAQITHLPSPAEREDIMKRKIEKSGHRLAGADGVLDIAKAVDDEKFKLTAIVRVIVLDNEQKYDLTSSNEDILERIQLEKEHGVLLNHVMLSDELRRQFGAGKTDRVLLQSLDKFTSCNYETDNVQVYPLFDMPQNFTADLLMIALKNWITLHSDPRLPLIVTPGTLLKFRINPDMDRDVLLSFPTDKSNNLEKTSTNSVQAFIQLHRNMFENLTINVNNRLTSNNKPEFLTYLPKSAIIDIDATDISVRLQHLGGLDDLPSKLLTQTEQCLCSSPLSGFTFERIPGLCVGAVMVTGPRGVGKTSLVRAVCQQLTGSPYYTYVTMIDCKQLRGKRIDNIKKTLQKCFTEAAWRQPSVCVLDDLDLICGAPSGPAQEMSGDAMYFAKVAQVICELMKTEMLEKSQICIIATCKSRSAVNQGLSSSRGVHFFQNIIQLNPPDKDQRIQILTSIIQNLPSSFSHCVNNLDLNHVVNKTEGFVANDLQIVVQRALHAHTMIHRGDTQDRGLTNEDFNVALTGFTPSSLKNVSLHKPGDLGWQDVGGLHNVRNTLVETLQWPSKYPELFSNCPLRLRSGILLYGAPGTGKTLLAGVVAKECGLNFISIKGPELLSKYIGASEQAVRDTFIRAQSAKPCILFFDEFDSLAPRRGHDSTGVTDRVVNQLLTQLDGVEGLQGVYVLAATSRPDLIDPALLRPGRLDKALCCDLPKQEERLEILESLTRNIHLSEDVNLHHLAQTCDYFTGADFKALLYNAQLEAIHEVHGQNLLSDIQSMGKKHSEGSILLNGSWEKVNLENSVDLMVDNHQSPIKSSSNSVACDIAYIPSLEDGISKMTHEVHEQIKDQIYPHIEQHEGTNEIEKASTSVVIQNCNFLEALKTMGPSVSVAERRKYQIIYENFIHSRGGNFSDGIQSAGKRATLA